MHIQELSSRKVAPNYFATLTRCFIILIYTFPLIRSVGLRPKSLDLSDIALVCRREESIRLGQQLNTGISND